jgi:hypothetical protein
MAAGDRDEVGSEVARDLRFLLAELLLSIFLLSSGSQDRVLPGAQIFARRFVFEPARVATLIPRLAKGTEEVEVVRVAGTCRAARYPSDTRAVSPRASFGLPGEIRRPRLLRHGSVRWAAAQNDAERLGRAGGVSSGRRCSPESPARRPAPPGHSGGLRAPSAGPRRHPRQRRIVAARVPKIAPTGSGSAARRCVNSRWQRRRRA